jgi:hypothetical protein
MSKALFLGRFQPPHVGHLLTIRKLLTKHPDLSIGVTECQPSVMEVGRVIEVLKSLLPDLELGYEEVTGSVEGGTAKLPEGYDVFCSGNSAVLKVLSAQGLMTDFVERSMDEVFSGTRIRNEFVDKTIKGARMAEDLGEFRVVETKSLRPIERINRRHYETLEKDILKSQKIDVPLIVDRVTLAVLDGSHRYAFLRKHGFSKAPIIACDYDDESIFVGNHLSHRFEFDVTKWLTKSHVRATAVSGKLYPARTTRHFFPFRKKKVPIPLEQLGKGLSESIETLYSDNSLEEELDANIEYIHEINQEMEMLASYIKEQKGVKKWLEMQNTEMVRTID